MKHINRQKWMLSALLIAALGSQYYFSTPSNELSSIELSSRSIAHADDDAAPAEGVSADQTARDVSADSTASDVSADSTASDVSADQTARDVSADASERSDTEASADTATRSCTNCVAILVPRDQVDSVIEIIASTRSGDTSARTTADRDDAPPADETRAERRAREAAERREAEAERRMENEQDFEDRVEALVDRCSDDVRCLSGGFSTILMRYTGRKQLSTAVVRRAYATHIEGRIRDAVISGDAQTAAAAIDELSRYMPSQYRDLNRAVVETVQVASNERAAAINGNLRTATQLASQPNGLAQSNILMQQAMADQYSFQRDSQIYATTFTDTLRAAGDASTLAHVQSTFIPSLQTLIAGLGNTGTTTTPAGSPTSRGTVRGGEAPPIATTGGAPGATVLTAPAPATPGTAVFGAPGTPSNRGRGSY